MSEERAPLMVTDDGEVPFVAPVSGVTPTAPSHLVTKAYVDAGGGPKAPINNPTFTGIAVFEQAGSLSPPATPQRFARVQELNESQALQDAATIAFLSAFYLAIGGAATSLAMSTARLLGRTAGGTGAVQELSAADVRTFLGLGALALLGQANLATQVTGTLPIANGGTGATSAGAALAALGAAEVGHTHDPRDVLLDESEFSGSLAGSGIANVKDLALWIDANLTP
jgi:hypothetical protein